MAQEYKLGEIVPQSGIYTITHDPAHAGMPHEVTVIKGRRFPTCRHCKGVTFQVAHAARHVGEIDHLKEGARAGRERAARWANLRSPFSCRTIMLLAPPPLELSDALFIEPFDYFTDGWSDQHFCRCRHFVGSSDETASLGRLQ